MMEEVELPAVCKLIKDKLLTLLYTMRIDRPCVDNASEIKSHIYILGKCFLEGVILPIYGFWIQSIIIIYAYQIFVDKVVEFYWHNNRLLDPMIVSLPPMNIMYISPLLLLIKVCTDLVLLIYIFVLLMKKSGYHNDQRC